MEKLDENAVDYSKYNLSEWGDVKLLDTGIWLVDSIGKIPNDKYIIELGLIVFVFVKEGRMQLTINDKVHLAQKDDIVFCTSTTVLKDALLSPEFKCTVLGIASNRLMSVFNLNGAALIQKVLFARKHPVLRCTPEEIQLFESYRTFFMQKLTMKHSAYFSRSVDGIVLAAVYDLLSIIDRLMAKYPDVRRKLEALFQTTIVQQYIRLVLEDNCEHRTIQYFAEKLNVSAKYLASLCTRETGKSPSYWLHKQQVDKIRYLLLNTTMSCKQITKEMHFPNTSFFGKFVKDRLGVAPEAYRKENRKK